MLNKTITIESIETKQASTGNWKYILKTTDGEKYYFYKDTQYGLSEAFETFDSLQPQRGDQLIVSYTEEEKSFVNQEGKTINYTDRFVKNIISTGQTPLLSNKSSTIANKVTIGQDNYGQRLAIHGMVNGLLASGVTPQQVSVMLPDLLGLEEDINLALK